MRTSNFLAATLAVGLLVLATANAKDTDVAKDAVEAWFAKQVNSLLPLLDRLSLVGPFTKECRATSPLGPPSLSTQICTTLTGITSQHRLRRCEVTLKQLSLPPSLPFPPPFHPLLVVLTLFSDPRRRGSSARLLSTR